MGVSIILIFCGLVSKRIYFAILAYSDMNFIFFGNFVMGLFNKGKDNL